MKLLDRQPVDGTQKPVIYIGHREWIHKDGTVRKAKPWYAEWFLHDKRQCKSLGVNNKVAAIKEAHRLHEMLCNGKSIHAPKEITIEEIARRYVALKRGEPRAPKTVKKYESITGLLVEHCRDRGVIYASRFTEEDFWSFQDGCGYAAKTVYDRRMIILQLFKWATERAEVIVKNPIRLVKMKEPESPPQPCFTPVQVDAMIDTANPTLRQKILFLAYTGCRFGEFRDLQWGDLNFDIGKHGFVTIRRGGSSGLTKNKKSRRIPLHELLAVELKRMPRSCELVFPAAKSHRYPNGDGKQSDTYLLKQVKKLCKECEFPNPNQYKVHTFRHFFASMMARNNVSYKYALVFMGHSDSKILDLYYTMYDEDAEQAIATIQF